MQDQIPKQWGIRWCLLEISQRSPDNETPANVSLALFIFVKFKYLIPLMSCPVTLLRIEQTLKKKTATNIHSESCPWWCRLHSLLHVRKHLMRPKVCLNLKIFSCTLLNKVIWYYFKQDPDPNLRSKYPGTSEVGAKESGSGGLIVPPPHDDPNTPRR